MQSLASLYPGSTIQELLASNTPGWTCFNPSIVRVIDDHYWCVIRSSNFQEKNGEYFFNDPDNICRTRNYLAYLGDDLKIRSLELIDSSAVDTNLFPVRGMEDARLIYDRNSSSEFKLCGTVRDARSDGLARVAVDSLTGTQVSFRSFLPPSSPGAYAKNYMPVEGTKEFVEKCYPAGIITRDHEWLCYPLESSETAEGFRGGSQVINFWGRHIAVIHEVEFTNHGRIYWHRFVEFDDDHTLIGAGEPFYFIDQGIEFAAGLAVYEDQLVISFGHQDTRAMLALAPCIPVLESLTEKPFRDQAKWTGYQIPH